MSFYCPKCNAIIYSRRAPNCASCGAPLPPEIRLSSSEIAAEDKQDAECRKWDQASSTASNNPQQRSKVGTAILGILIILYAVYLFIDAIAGLWTGHVRSMSRHSHTVIYKQTDPTRFWQSETEHLLFATLGLTVGAFSLYGVIKSNAASRAAKDSLP